ncbi:hypothetical protein F2Q68_00025644 [Brassica cretica]|uniref:Uncharacterized protein n=1 Tax=Brassica cretica TaxID=69181 RepID=A0A8S9IE44_BRACR|nr:hypothetical protein F2Q68_00025644 [Brassica cretica]
MIHESLQLATVEWNTRQNTRRRSKLTLQHRSTVAIRNRPTHHMKNRRDDADYEEERATEYKAILDEEDTLLHHSSWKRNAPSIDMTSSPSIDTQPHQINWKRASTDIANYSSIDAEIDEVKAKVDSVHKLLRKQVCLVEDAEAVDTEGRAEEEEEVNFIGGTGFQGSGNRNSYGNRGREAARRRFRIRKSDEL